MSKHRQYFIYQAQRKVRPRGYHDDDHDVGIGGQDPDDVGVEDEDNYDAGTRTGKPPMTMSGTLSTPRPLTPSISILR